jgi:hypothetical protein
MRRSVFGSLEALLAPDALARLAGHPVASVRAMPFATADSASGSTFLRVEAACADGAPDARYLVKRSGRDRDWLMRATDDPGREALLWRDGVFDRLPPDARATILAVARDDGRQDAGGADGDELEGGAMAAGWALLLRDVSPSLLPPRFEPITAEVSAQMLDGIAALHATFYQAAETLALPYLCDPARYYMALAPRTGRSERGATPVAERILHGWALLPTRVPPDVAATVAALHDDPRPLVAALARYPHTLLHGDLRRANLALTLDPQPCALLLDWQLAHAGPPAADLAWYLADPLRQPISKEETIAAYRERLATRLGARYDAASWEPTLALGLLGGLLRFGWLLALFATEHADSALRDHYRAELGWWAERARDGARRL